MVGTFYRPPESSSLVFTDFENSIGMAVDTGISDIVILGDFNLNTWGDRKVRIKMLSFLYFLLFRDEVTSNNAAIYMQLIHCNNACIKRARALQLSLWKHRLALCGAT